MGKKLQRSQKLEEVTEIFQKQHIMSSMKVTTSSTLRAPGNREGNAAVPFGPPGALHITGMTQTLPRRRAGLYLPIPAACTSQASPISLQTLILFPCSPCQPWTSSPLHTFGCQPHC